ncbi:MAG: hypothetical protein COZ12_00465 [Deltaproteobacteria bacterium CG_4_10_14_3_um_filter_60_8]|nr:MAG: hypothetical protein COZ12_00465 [Deltaproteobacteria bacterium CG_4_10_14_3_um_filter_60_8]
MGAHEQSIPNRAKAAHPGRIFFKTLITGIFLAVVSLSPICQLLMAGRLFVHPCTIAVLLLNHSAAKRIERFSRRAFPHPLLAAYRATRAVM